MNTCNAITQLIYLPTISAKLRLKLSYCCILLNLGRRYSIVLPVGACIIYFSLFFSHTIKIMNGSTDLKQLERAEKESL